MVKIVGDTSSCVSPREAAQRGIAYLPQLVIFGEDTYRDDTEMDARKFLKLLAENSKLPKTAAPPPALYGPIYQEYAEQGYTIIVVCPSAEVSGTVRGATVAAQDFPEADIRIIDTHLIAGGLGAVLIEAQKWAEMGLDADTVVKNIEEMASRNRVYFMVDTLEYLYKGGRIGAAKALFGSLLQVKPILTFRDGHIESFESQRTQKKALARMREIVLSDCPRHPNAHLCVMHGDANGHAESLAKELGTLLDIPESEIPIYDLTPAILTHAGPGVLAVSYFVAG